MCLNMLSREEHKEYEDCKHGKHSLKFLGHLFLYNLSHINPVAIIIIFIIITTVIYELTLSEIRKFPLGDWKICLSLIRTIFIM